MTPADPPIGLVLDERPSPARILDHLRGGAHTYADDRRVGDAVLAAVPEMPDLLRTEWMFRTHAFVRAVAAGVDEVIELSAGISRPGTVAGIERRLVSAPMRFVITDADPVAVEQQRLAHRNEPDVTVVRTDPRKPDLLLDRVLQLLTLRRPVLVLGLGVLAHLSDSAAVELLGAIAERLPAASRLALSHLVSDGQPDAVTSAVTELYAETSWPLRLRTRRQLRTLLRESGLAGITVPDTLRPRPRRRSMLAVATASVPVSVPGTVHTKALLSRSGAVSGRLAGCLHPMDRRPLWHDLLPAVGSSAPTADDRAADGLAANPSAARTASGSQAHLTAHPTAWSSHV